LAPFVHVLVIHALDGSLAHYDHAAFVHPFGQQAELACPETVPLLAELLEEPVGHLGVAVAGAVLAIFLYDQHAKVLELAGWFPAGSEHDAAAGHDLLKPFDTLCYPSTSSGQALRQAQDRPFDKLRPSLRAMGGGDLFPVGGVSEEEIVVFAGGQSKTAMGLKRCFGSTTRSPTLVSGALLR
jgi:hypothetical protein